MDVPLLARPQSAVIIVLWEMGSVAWRYRYSRCFCLESGGPVGGTLRYVPGDAGAQRKVLGSMQHTSLMYDDGTSSKGEIKSHPHARSEMPAGKQWGERWLATAAVYVNVTLPMLSVKLPPLSMSSISLLTPPWHSGVWFSEAVVLNDGATEIQSDGSFKYWGAEDGIFCLFTSPQKDQSPICSIFRLSTVGVIILSEETK